MNMRISYIHLSLFNCLSLRPHQSIYFWNKNENVYKNETIITHFVAIPIFMINEWESGVENMKNGDLGVHNWIYLE